MKGLRLEGPVKGKMYHSVFYQKCQYKAGVRVSLCLPCASCRLVQSYFCPCNMGLSKSLWKSVRVPRHPGLALVVQNNDMSYTLPTVQSKSPILSLYEQDMMRYLLCGTQIHSVKCSETHGNPLEIS